MRGWWGGGRGWVLPEMLDGGVQPTPQNPQSIYDQNLRFLLPYLWPGQKLDSLFMTVAADAVALNISYEGRLLTVLLIMMKKWAFSEKHTQFKTRLLKPYHIYGQNRYPIYVENGWKTLPFGAAYTYIAHIREYPPGINPRLWYSWKVLLVGSYSKGCFKRSRCYRETPINEIDVLPKGNPTFQGCLVS